MIKLFKFIIPFAILSTVFSCHKHEEIIAPEDYIEYGDINVLFQKNLEDIKVIEPFDAENGLKYAIRNKAEINIPKGCLVNTAGKKATGTAELSFIEIYDKGTMAITNKPTTAPPYSSPQDNGEYITPAAGIYYIKVLQGNSELKNEACTPKITTPAISIGDKLPNLNLGEHEGIFIDRSQNIDWVNMRFPENNYTEPILNLKNLGWNSLLICPIITTTELLQYTTVTFNKPKSLNEVNSRIFIAIEGQDIGLGYPKSKVKIKQKAHYILVVANQSNDGFYYAIKKSQTITQNPTISFTTEDLKEATPQELKKIMNALP